MGLESVLGVLNSPSGQQLSNAYDVPLATTTATGIRNYKIQMQEPCAVARFRVISFDYATTIPIGQTHHKNIRQGLYRHTTFRLPTLSDRLACYSEFTDLSQQRSMGTEAAVCISLCHYFARLLDLLYISGSFEGGLLTVEQRELVRDMEIEMDREGEYTRLYGIAMMALEMPIFQVSREGLLPMNCMLYLGVRLLIQILNLGNGGDGNIIGEGRILIQVLLNAEIMIHLNPRRTPWLTAVLLLASLFVPRDESNPPSQLWLYFYSLDREADG